MQTMVEVRINGPIERIARLLAGMGRPGVAKLVRVKANGGRPRKKRKYTKKSAYWKTKAA